MAGLVFLIPIIAILTSHQRKMAELIHGRKEQQGQQADTLPHVHDRLSHMEREMAELKDLVRNQTIALDNLANARPVTGSQSQLTERLHD